MESSFEGTYLNGYKFEKYLKGGSQCSVFESVHLKTGRKVAIKVFFLNDMHSKLKAFLNGSELLIYRSIRNENILKIDEYFESGAHGFVVYEFCMNRTLESFWIDKHQKHIEERMLIKIIRQIFHAYRDLIENSLFRRDYTLRNILIHKSKVKLGDCLHFMKASSFQFSSQREYLAPEVLEEGENLKEPGKADLWTLGVSIYKLTYGQSPFHGITDFLLLKDIKNKMEKNTLKYERNDLIYGEDFQEVLKKIFRPVESRSIVEVFQSQLLRKKYKSQDFNSEDMISFKSDSNEKSKKHRSYDKLVKSAPVDNFVKNKDNIMSEDENVQKKEIAEKNDTEIVGESEEREEISFKFLHKKKPILMTDSQKIEEDLNECCSPKEKIEGATTEEETNKNNKNSKEKAKLEEEKKYDKSFCSQNSLKRFFSQKEENTHNKSIKSTNEIEEKEENRNLHYDKNVIKGISSSQKVSKAKNQEISKKKGFFGCFYRE